MAQLDPDVVGAIVGPIVGIPGLIVALLSARTASSALSAGRLTLGLGLQPRSRSYAMRLSNVLPPQLTLCELPSGLIP